MKKILLSLALILSCYTNTFSEDYHKKPNKRPNIPFGNVGWKRHGNIPNNVGYMPVIAWFPNGTIFNVGPVAVSADRRYVTIGINMGFSQVTEVHTFNFVTGEQK